jgi:hypothetical protein
MILYLDRLFTYYSKLFIYYSTLSAYDNRLSAYYSRVFVIAGISILHATDSADSRRDILLITADSLVLNANPPVIAAYFLLTTAVHFSGHCSLQRTLLTTANTADYSGQSSLRRTLLTTAGTAH